MKIIVTIHTENYDPSLPQTEMTATQEQINSVARGLYQAVMKAMSDPSTYAEYQQWKEEQKGKESNDSNNN